MPDQLSVLRHCKFQTAGSTKSLAPCDWGLACEVHPFANPQAIAVGFPSNEALCRMVLLSGACQM